LVAISQEQGAEPRTRPLGISPANDNELLSVQALDHDQRPRWKADIRAYTGFRDD